MVSEQVTDLGSGVHVIAGALDNTTVIEGRRCLVVVDTQFPPRYPAIAARIAAISPKPVLYVIDTHYHPDHTGGNAPFRQAGARIMAHVSVAGHMKVPPVDPLTGRSDPPRAAEALPTDSYAGPTATLATGGVVLRLVHPVAAHTEATP